MSEENITYISKADCIKRGLTRCSNGLYKRFNTLEKYALQGHLHGARYETALLVLAGNILYRDYYKSRINKIATSNPSKIKVDIDSFSIQSDEVLIAKDLYNKAMRSIPKEFWRSVVAVCCRDEEVHTFGTKWQKERQRYHSIELLKLGLCRLADFYKHQNKYNQFNINQTIRYLQI